MISTTQKVVNRSNAFAIKLTIISVISHIYQLRRDEVNPKMRQLLVDMSNIDKHHTSLHHKCYIFDIVKKTGQARVELTHRGFRLKIEDLGLFLKFRLSLARNSFI